MKCTLLHQDIDYPPDRLIISILDDGYFSRIEGQHRATFTVTSGGIEVEHMARVT